MTDFPQNMANRIELWPIERLIPYKSNARDHSPEQVRRIAASIAEFGFLQPVLVDSKSREIIAGHGRVLAARQIGSEFVPVVPLDHLTEAQARAFRIADNRLAELSTWNDAKLREEIADLATKLPELPELGFDAGKLRRLLTPARTAPTESVGSEAPQPPTVPTAKLGDVWTCGAQRLVCGDSRVDSVRRLGTRGELAQCVLTDPPYAIFGSSTGVGSDVADDRMVLDFFERVLQSAAAVLARAGHAYIFCDWRSYPAWWQAHRGKGLAVANLLVWNKRGMGLGSNYMNHHELVAFLHRVDARASSWSKTAKGTRPVNRSNVLDFNRAGAGGFEAEEPTETRGVTAHNAAKPVELLRELVCNSTDAGELVVDLFGGSGSTLLACELTRRRGVAVEIEPKWVDVALERLERIVGSEAVLEGDGPPAERTRSRVRASRAQALASGEGTKRAKFPRRRRAKKSEG